MARSGRLVSALALVVAAISAAQLLSAFVAVAPRAPQMAVSMAEPVAMDVQDDLFTAEEALFSAEEEAGVLEKTKSRKGRRSALTKVKRKAYKYSMVGFKSEKDRLEKMKKR